MSFFKKIINSFESNNPIIQENISSDTFADDLILEIRRAVHEAIIFELQRNEGRFLTKILKNSFFPIESISLVPLDHEIALKTNDFFKAHAELNINFERDFLANNLPSEYRTSKGARALILQNTLFNIKPSKLGSDKQTQEESYQTTIRGKRKNFSAEVTIGTINADSNKNFVNTEFVSQIQNQTVSHPIDEHSINQRKKVFITIEDGNGKSDLTLNLPLIIGRQSPDENYGEFRKVNIKSTYISRNQFVVIDILGTIYGFVPSEAKLTAVSGRRGTIRPLSLIKIDEQGLFLTFGQPLDIAAIVVNCQKPNLYASVTIKPCDLKQQSSLTPVPNVIK